MNPIAWKEMVIDRELSAMGDGIKRVEENEKSTVIIQRRGCGWPEPCKGESSSEWYRNAATFLENGFKPYELNHVLGAL